MFRKLTRQILTALSLLAAAGAAAHSLTSPGLLSGLVFCLDPSSVRIEYWQTPDQRDLSRETALRERVATNLEQTLQASRVRFHKRDSCRHHDDFLLIHTTLKAFGSGVNETLEPGEFLYTLSVQVGDYTPPGALLEGAYLSTVRYGSFGGGWLSEARSGRSLAEAVPAMDQAVIDGLAAAWWQDNPPHEHLLTRLASPPVVGTALAIATLLMIPGWWKRRLSR